TMPSSNYIVDGTPGGAANFNVVATNIMNAAGGRISVRYMGGEVAGQNIMTNDEGANVPVALPHDTSGLFEVVITDLAGNPLTVVSAAAVVDVLPPDAPTVNATLSDAREA